MRLEGSASAPGPAEAGVPDGLREFWDDDAVTYDRSSAHYPERPQEQAAWAATLRRLLPPPPAAVLDMGAGTGFLSLLLAAQGYQVTAADFSAGMLARLRAKATDRGLAISVAQTDALHPPEGPFDARLWFNAATPVDVGDTDIAAIAMLAARRLGPELTITHLRSTAENLGQVARVPRPHTGAVRIQ